MRYKFNNLEKQEYSIFFLFFLNFISTCALIKYCVLRFIFQYSPEKIRSHSYGNIFLDKFSKINKKIRENATSWKALDELYNYDNRYCEYTFSEKLLSKIWMRTKNAQSLRNRAQMVKEIIKVEISNKIKKNPKSHINILSIASGSAQPLLESISSFDAGIQKKINLTLLDLDRDALVHSREMIKKLNIQCNIKTINDTASTISVHFGSHEFDFIEMVGFMDYKTHDKGVDLTKRVKSILKKDGIFLTCNIHPNKEKYFLDWLLLWPMIYRDKETFFKLLLDSGFTRKNIMLIYEYHKVNLLAICK